MKRRLTTLFTALVLTTMTGCASLGNQIGVAWVTHNTSTNIVTALNDSELIPLSVAKEFQSYQIPVKNGLDAATEDYLDGDGDYTQAELIMDMLQPMLERMTQIQGDNNGTD